MFAYYLRFICICICLYSVVSFSKGPRLAGLRAWRRPAASKTSAGRLAHRYFISYVRVFLLVHAILIYLYWFIFSDYFYVSYVLIYFHCFLSYFISYVYQFALSLYCFFFFSPDGRLTARHPRRGILGVQGCGSAARGYNIIIIITITIIISIHLISYTIPILLYDMGIMLTNQHPKRGILGVLGCGSAAKDTRRPAASHK